jgi:hypothetical protein
LDATRRYEAQELGLRAISPKMVEQQLEGDNVSDLVFIALWARPGS